jgi:hypothetical protein
MALLTAFELKEFDSASLTNAYQNFGSALGNPCYGAVLSNESTVGVYISIDGTTNTFRLSPGQILQLIPYSRHNTALKGSYMFKEGTQLSIKYVTGAGTGAIIANLQLTR